MHYALEVRSPFLDFRIFEFTRSIPYNVLFKNQNLKFLLKRIAFNKLSKELMDRPKSGFSVPLAQWFRKEMKDMVYDLINQDLLDDLPFLNKKEINRSIQNHMERKENRYVIIWKLLVFALWKNKNK